jgi:hypothetical protein
MRVGVDVLFSRLVNVLMHSRRAIVRQHANLWQEDGDLPPWSAGRPKDQGPAEVRAGTTVLGVSKWYTAVAVTPYDHHITY